MPVQIWHRSEFSLTFSKRSREMYASPSSEEIVRGLSMEATMPTPVTISNIRNKLKILCQNGRLGFQLVTQKLTRDLLPEDLSAI